MTVAGLDALILIYRALVHTSFLLLDVGEGVAEAGWRRVFGGEGVAAGADLDGAVAGCGRIS